MTNPFQQNQQPQAPAAGYGQQDQGQQFPPAAFQPQGQQFPPADPQGQQFPPAAPQQPPAAPQQPQAPAGMPGIQTSPQGNPQATAPAVNLADRFAHGTAGGGEKLMSDENMGRAIVVKPLEVTTMNTIHGETQAVRAEWLFLDTFAQSGQTDIQKGLIFSKAVVRSLIDVLNSPALDFTVGVIAKQDPATVKRGNSPAWLINDAPEWVDTAVAAITAGRMI